MFAETMLSQGVMAITAVAWFIIYDSSFTCCWLAVTFLFFVLSTKSFFFDHLPDITSFGVPTTLFFIILSPILLGFSPFQGRDVAASIPLFVCAVLFCTVELGRGARALERLADHRNHGYIPIADDIPIADGSRTPLLMEDRDTSDTESRMSKDLEKQHPRRPRRPRRSRISIALETMHAEQAAPVRYGWDRVGSKGSIQLTTDSMSVRDSVADFVGSFGDGTLADDNITYTLPRDRGPYHSGRWYNELPQMDPENQSDSGENQPGSNESQSESDESQSGPNENQSDPDDHQP
ncbi:hypothetical protein V490_04044 [Pseudogymnoascus sp. VKM F-3557]|nr:hypothetical protein V490_04044 [Pseudogymnoascus sp. VKM F-3557]